MMARWPPVVLWVSVERDGFGLRICQADRVLQGVAAVPFLVRRHIRDYDLVHIHALFSFTSTCAARAAHQLAYSYVIRPLGVLNRWGMNNRRRALNGSSFH
jgi:hypothetical protein